LNAASCSYRRSIRSDWFSDLSFALADPVLEVILKYACCCGSDPSSVSTWTTAQNFASHACRYEYHASIVRPLNMAIKSLMDVATPQMACLQFFITNVSTTRAQAVFLRRQP
jgi:hypothetical protein